MYDLETSIFDAFKYKIGILSEFIPFKKQITANADSDSGDSGSIVINDNNEAVGLVFAGNRSTIMFTDINSVLNKLKVELFF